MAMTHLDAFFRPRGVAFVGATEDPAKLGGRRFRSLVEEGFEGRIYPVHPRAERLRGLPAYRSVLDLPDPVDLAVIVVPQEAVPATLADCGRRGISAAVIVTAGFGEVDAAGRRLERDMVAEFRCTGGRLLGPNCAGLFDAASNLNVGGAEVPRGEIALVSQSGNLLLDFSQHARERGLGFSRQVTIGNAADLGAVELVADCLRDPGSRVVLAYLEGWAEGEGRALFELARDAANCKPIVLLKPGLSEAGRRAALSHTGALAGEDRIVDAAMRQCGILRAETIEAAWDLAAALCRSQELEGNRVAVVSDGGGHATVLSDALGRAGLQVPSFSASTRAALGELLPARAAIGNPVDFAGVVETEPGVLPRVLEICLEAPEVDAVALAGHFGGYHKIGGAALEALEIAAAAEVAGLAGRASRPLVVHSIYAGERLAALERLRRSAIPVLRAPEAAALLLAGLYRAGSTASGERTPVRRLSDPETCPTAARAVLAEGAPTGALLEPEARRLVAAYGVPVPDFDLAGTAEACAQAVAEGAPKALKLIAHGIVHRSEVDGVLLNVAGADVARRAFEALMGRLPAECRATGRVLVTAMIEDGVEVICGAFRDPQFGSVVMFGLGGVAVEASADVAFRLAPLALPEALAMLDEIRGRALLDAHRGRPAVDRESAAEILVRLGELMLNLPEVTEVDLNPVFLRTNDAVLADARVVLG